MKIIIRTFFKLLRIVLGPFMLLWERVTRPSGLVRSPESQKAIDQVCDSLVLYQFTTCPFCIKVRQAMRRLALPIQRLDAQKDLKNRDDLFQGGGTIKVPCLRVTDSTGNSQWIYESGAIIAYLEGRFASA